MSHHLSARREFLRFLAASPLAAQAFAQSPKEPYTPAYMAPESAKDALDVMDFDPLPRKAPPRAQRDGCPRRARRAAAPSGRVCHRG